MILSILFVCRGTEKSMVLALHDLVMAASTFDLVVIPFLIVVIVALVALIFVFARKNSFSMGVATLPLRPEACKMLRKKQRCSGAS